MAIWESKSVSEVVSKISDNQIVLPVIQRRLVWDEEKMELLFDTLLKGNSFGGVMAIDEEKGTKPLFACRYFSKDGSNVESINLDGKLDNEQLFIIDGQQRLQTFYIGLHGSINGKVLYFNLASDYKNLEYDFKFSSNSQKLKKKEKRDDVEITNIWHSVSSLYQRLRKTNDEDQVADEIIADKEITSESDKDLVQKNIRKFYKSLFATPAIGISKVSINKTLDPTANKQRIVELFRRLNDGGTRLSSFDLVASILKGFEWKMEKFLDEILEKYKEIGIDQDEIIKLIFILQDNHKKEMASIDSNDAKFAIDNQDRIRATLSALEKFLTLSKLHDYYKEGNRSSIPLYFIAYSIYHQDIDNKDVENIFDKHDVKSNYYKSIYRWVYLSLLNGVFKSRGAGWIPYKTGIRKILEVVKKYKGKEFPTDEVFNCYRLHPLHFFKTGNVDPNELDNYEDSFTFYLMYDRQKTIRRQDIDHIHPQNILEKSNVDWEKINSISNFQLLDSGTNRGEKNGKPLEQWINNHIDNVPLYLKIHSIPSDNKLWDASRFDNFLDERGKILSKKIDSYLV